MLELLVPDRGERKKYFLDEENLDLIEVKKGCRKCNKNCKNNSKKPKKAFKEVKAWQ